MKYIKHFKNYSDFEKVKDSLVRPNVSFIEEENNKVVEYLPDGPGGGGSGEGYVNFYDSLGEVFMAADGEFLVKE